VFAGAAREAVFSQPDVIRQIQAGFIPVALKAGLVNNPGDDEEGRLYREIGRSKPAPQGIAVVNSDGRVLAWALSFDAPSRIEDFLDRQAKRYEQFPDATRPAATERYMKFPSSKMDDVPDAAAAAPAALAHPSGKACPATPRVPKGTLLARVIGRALGADGKPVADTARQEHYVEDRLEIPTGLQEAFARAVAEAGDQRAALPELLAKLLVGHAYLGQLDVDPQIRPNARPSCELWAKKVRDGLYRIEGRSEFSGGQDDKTGNGARDGRQWGHAVTLTWEGMAELRGSRVTRVSLLARGTEKLTWRNPLAKMMGEEDVAHLPAGRAIDFDGRVVYGVRAEPVPDAEAGEPEPQAGMPPQSLRDTMERLGPAVQAFARGGGDLKSLQPELEKLQHSLERRDFAEAEKQAEKIRELVGKK
jgi:hypothetical protein